LSLGTVKTEQSNTIVWDANNRRSDSTSADVGSTVQGGGSLSLQAGQAVNATEANVQAVGALEVHAKDIQLQAGQAAQSVDEAHQHVSKGFLSKTTTTTRDTLDTSTALASNFGGATVSLNASQDIDIKGSNVVSDSGTILTAGGNIHIEAANNTSQQSSYSQQTETGFLSGGGIGISYGTRTQSNDGKDTTTTAAASTVGSLNGNVSIAAGNQYKQVGSDVLTPNGDITIIAKKVDIVEARETNKQSTEQKFEQSAISAGLSGGIIDSVQAATHAVQAAKDSSSNRNRNLNTLIAYGKGSDAYEQGKATQDAYEKNGVMGGTNADGTAAPGAAAASGIKVSVSIGTSKSQSSSSTTSDTTAGSTVKAGGNVSIKATGQGDGEGNLTVQGSNVSAAKDVTLSATKDVNILASADTESNRSSNKSSSTSVGVSFGIGAGGGGFSLDIAASRGKGQANSDSTTYNNSHITAGNAVNITSGADTNIKGGNIKANQVSADVGGNLNVESLQDKAVSEASQKTTGIALSIPIGAGTGSVSFSQSKQNSNSNYASVNEQSGIKAGDGGFNVNVKGNTDLKGAVIASTDKATQDGKNTLTTKTLTTSDISNSMSASASSSGVSVGTNMLDGKYAMGKAVVGNLLNNGSANQSDASTTTSAISAATVTVGSKTTDTSKEGLKDSNGKTVSTDTSNTNRTLAKADVAGLQKSAQEQQAANMLAFKAATAFTDEAYRTMYKAGAQMYRVPPGCSDKSCAVPLTEQEAMALKTSPQDGKVHLSNNGIFNDLDGAVKYAQQHGGTMNEDGSKNYSDKPENQYIIFAPQANNVLSELIIAGVQKSGATPTVGLTNAEEQTAKIVQQATQQGQGVVIDSHSRGTLTTDNALQSINNQGGIKDESGNTIKPNIQMNNYGGAQSNDTGNQTLQQVTGNKDSQINSVVHPNDFIGTVIGGNQATPSYTSTTNGIKTEVTSTSDGKDPVSNVVNTMTGTITPHNCYGTAGKECGDTQWDNIPKNNSPSIANPDYKTPVVIPQYQQVDKLAPQVHQSSNEQVNQLLQSPPSITTQTAPVSQSNDKLETLKNFKQEQ
jgi:filamentous hemagglutinin